MTEQQYELIFNYPEFMIDFFERFTQAMTLAIDEEIMEDGNPIFTNETTCLEIINTKHTNS